MNFMRISGRKLQWIVGIVVALTKFSAHAQVLYSFVQMTDPNLIQASSLGSDNGAPGINENGRVAFGGFDSVGHRSGIFSADGTERQSSDYAAMAVPPAAKPTLYGSYVGSRVIFWGTVNGQEGAFNSDGANIETVIIDPTIKNSSFHRPLMNGTRQYAYVGGDPNSGKYGVYIAQNGTSNAVYTIPPISERSGLQLAGVFEFDAIPVQINDTGDVFFDGVFSCRPHNPPQANDCTDELEGIVKGSHGNPPTLLVPEGTVNPAGDFVSIDALWASHSGLLAYVVSTSDDTGIYYRLVRANNPVTDTRSGPFESFGYVAINNGGSMVFFAEFRDAAGKHNEGLFNGSDPVRNKIIALGDPLFDSTVVSFAWHPVGFNDFGQVAFRANLASGKSVIVRADPADGSTQVEWIGPGSGLTPLSGSATVTSNWKPLNGDPPRVPTKNTSFSDTALFDRPGEYTVAPDNQHADRLIVKNGHLTLRGVGTITVDALSFEQPSVVIDDNALMTLAFSTDLAPLGPTIICNHAVIGGFAAARAEVIENARWVANGSLRVGGPGEGRLTIKGGGDVTSAESRVGAAGGHATVGFGGFWTTGNLAIGIDHGVGEMTIEDGGRVNSDRAVIGQELSPGNGVNNVTVQGGEPSNPSTWHPGFLTVGGNDWGNLTVQNGGLVTVDVSLTVGAQAGVTGKVIVSGANASAVPSRITAEQISVGDVGNGDLLIKDAAAVEAVILKVGSHGKLDVEGLTGDNFLPSKLTVSDLSLSSLVRAWSMSIYGRAEVVSHNATIFSPDPSLGNGVLIVGNLASWKVEAVGAGTGTGFLKVGLDNDIPQGRALIKLDQGASLIADHIIVGPRGVIYGYGTVINRGETVNHGTIGSNLTNFFNIVARPAVPRADGLVKATAVSDGPHDLSSGTITILGHYIQGPGGRLLIEIGGANPEAHSHVILGKGATLDGTLELRFVNGFAPKRGDTFDFVHVAGSLSGAFAAVEMKNLAPDFQFNVSTNGTNISMVALNDGVFVTPLQGQISSSNVITVGGISYLPYQLQVTNDCSIVEVSGELRREGQQLFQELSEQTDPGCQEQSANVSRILPLGALPPGNYQFHFILDGVSVHDVSFTVPADSGQLLKLNRVSSGELKLEISGLPGVLYTIQASADLKTWSDLPAHVGTFLGPYSILEPFSSARTRFYRVRVEI